MCVCVHACVCICVSCEHHLSSSSTGFSFFSVSPSSSPPSPPLDVCNHVYLDKDTVPWWDASTEGMGRRNSQWCEQVVTRGTGADDGHQSVEYLVHNMTPLIPSSLSPTWRVDVGYRLECPAVFVSVLCGDGRPRLGRCAVHGHRRCGREERCQRRVCAPCVRALAWLTSIIRQWWIFLLPALIIESGCNHTPIRLHVKGRAHSGLGS